MICAWFGGPEAVLFERFVFGADLLWSWGKTVRNGLFGVFGVCGGAEEILVCFRGLDIEICREGIIIIDGNVDFKKMYGFFLS